MVQDSGIEIFNSTGAVPGSCIGTSINCQDAESDFTVTGLTIGRNYYIRMYSWTSGSTPTNPDFTLCVTSPPANDNCAGAVAVPQEPNGTCTATSGTVTGATDSGIIEDCFGNANDDVWFYFVATATTAIINRTAAFDSEIEVFNSTGASPGSCIGTTIDCQDGEGSLTVTGLTIGRRYYYRIYSYSSTSPATGTFTTCVTSNPTPPANDEPCAATALTVGATCSYTASTTAGATNSSLTVGVTLPTCANFNGSDVWFTAVVPASGHLIFDSDDNGMTDSGMEIYRGTCASLTPLDCDDDGSTNGSMSMLEMTTLIPGETIWIRMWEYGNDNAGTFSICVTDGGGTGSNPCTGGAGGSTCQTMNPFCTSNTYCFTASTGSTAQSGNNYGCLSTQPNPTWYYFEISTAGALAFNMTATSDIDFALWGPYANLAAAQGACGSLPAPIDCSYSISPTETGNIAAATVGQVYVLVVTNYASVVQDIAISAAPGNTAQTNCAIVVPDTCAPDAGQW